MVQSIQIQHAMYGKITQLLSESLQCLSYCQHMHVRFKANIAPDLYWSFSMTFRLPFEIRSIHTCLDLCCRAFCKVVNRLRKILKNTQKALELRRSLDPNYKKQNKPQKWRKKRFDQNCFDLKYCCPFLCCQALVATEYGEHGKTLCKSKVIFDKGSSCILVLWVLFAEANSLLCRRFYYDTSELAKFGKVWADMHRLSNFQDCHIIPKGYPLISCSINIYLSMLKLCKLSCCSQWALLCRHKFLRIEYMHCKTGKKLVLWVPRRSSN